MYPHEFRFLWRLSCDGPSTADEIAQMLSRPVDSLIDWSGQRVGSQLRRLVRDGFVNRDPGRAPIYRLTEKGRAYVDA